MVEILAEAIGLLSHDRGPASSALGGLVEGDPPEVAEAGRAAGRPGASEPEAKLPRHQ
jgi:hypothetical protein